MATGDKDSRTFACKLDNGQTIGIRVRRASRNELEMSGMEESKIFNQALLNGIPPRMRLLRKLRENDLWTSEDDTRMSNLREQASSFDNQIIDLNAKIAAADEQTKVGLEADKAELVKGRAKAFRDLQQLRVEIDGMLGHTADAKAEDAQRDFLVACVSEKMNGEKVTGRVWDSVDAFRGEQDISLVQRVVYEYMTFNAGMPSEYEQDLAAHDEVEKTDEPKAVDQVEQAEKGASDTLLPSIAA